MIHKLAVAEKAAGGEERGRGAVEVGEFLELVFVGLTMFLGLGIMVAFGKWWER